MKKRKWLAGLLSAAMLSGCLSPAVSVTAAEVLQQEIQAEELRMEETESTEELQTEEQQTEETESTEELQTEETESTEELQTEKIESTEELQTEETESTEELQTEEQQTEETESTEELQTEETVRAEELQTEETESTEVLWVEEESADVQEEVFEVEKAEELKGASAAFVITSARELKEFAQKVTSSNTYSGKVVKLGADIVLDGVDNWSPISNFAGTFDGCGYSITGINVVSTTAQYVGLFGNCSGTIKNLTIKDSEFTATRTGSGTAMEVGAIAGYASSVINCRVENTSVTGTIIQTNYSYGYNSCVGGIVGSGGAVYNCAMVGGTVSGTYISNYNFSGVGGVAGYANSLYNSFNSASVSSDGGLAVAGGVAGRVGTMQNCYNIGTVSGESGSYGIVYSVKSLVANSYCSEESAETNIGSSSGAYESNNKALPLSEIQTQAFADTLNANRGSSHDDWLQWEIRAGHGFPQHVSLIRMSNASVKLSADTFTYNGEAQCPTVTVSYNGTTLTESREYTLSYTDNIEPGTATVTVEGAGRYVDGRDVTYTITPADITNAEVILSENICYYDGTEKTPELTVNLNGRTLNEEEDYTVTYQNNVNVGTATVTITGTGTRYVGTVTKTFTIEKKEQNISTAGTYNKTYGDKKFYVQAYRSIGDGKLTYKSSNTKVASVNKTSGLVKIKGTGQTVITVTAAETTSYKKTTVQVVVKVKPVKQTASISSYGKKYLTVKWKKDKTATGYQIQYAQNKKFTKNVNTVTVKKNSTTSKKIKKLKSKKTYYVRVRSYKVSKVDGKNVYVYGSWSKTLKQKVK